MIVTAVSLSEDAAGIQLLDQPEKTYPSIANNRVDAGFKETVIEHGANSGIESKSLPEGPESAAFTSSGLGRLRSLSRSCGDRWKAGENDGHLP
ncbi:hypothetical protein [Streptomyces scopuliridis]|uniref:hypothetical protein n=1 Tax=Streptomyces scopuliridis TaxID=452529 RepID=UPI00389997AB